jgi:PAS domain S-box-containing protein
MTKSINYNTRWNVLRNYLWLIMILWTIFIALVLVWNLFQERHETLEVVRIEARSAFEKDLVYRRWAAMHGGVYVPVTEQTPPNPYLASVAERDITTPSGQRLTLMNPAYMTRQVHKIGAEQYGLHGHITSLNPIRPANAADAWETEALRAFEQGEKEVSSVEKFNNAAYMRLMSPLVTEQSCLKCHAEQGYKVGDIRGGISVSVPMAPLQAVARRHIATLTLGHSMIWLLGIVGISLVGRNARHGIREHDRAEETLKLSEERYALAQQAANIGSWDWDILTNNLTWSEQIEPMFGFSAGDFGGTYEAFLDCVHPEDRQFVVDSVDASIKKGDDYKIEHRIIWPDDTVRWVSENGNVIRDENGRAIRMLGIVQDITEHKLAEQQIENLAKFPSENPNPVLRIAKDGTIIYSNQSSLPILELWHCREGERISGKWYGLISIALDSGEPRETEAEFEGTIYSLTCAPIKDADFVNVYALDITERKRAEEALRRARDELEHRVQDRTTELIKANEQLSQKIEELEQAEEALRKSESALLKSQDNLRFLAGRLISVQEEERRRLARNMHDDLTQRLALLAIEAGKLEQQLKSSPGPFREKLRQIKEQIVNLSVNVHDISRQLHPAILDDLGLVDAIKSECTSFSKREGITVGYEPMNIPASMPKDVALCIYRVIQESLRNIAKHANVKQAEVLLTGTDEGIRLCIKDKGVGFDMTSVHGKGGLGLASMEERVRLIHGEFSIQSQSGQGTVIELRIPLPRRPE